MGSGRPNTQVTKNALGSEVLILKLLTTQRDNLDNLAIVCSTNYVVLISAFRSQNNEVSISERADNQVELVARYSHSIERLFRLVGVAAPLKILVPHLEALVEGAGEELSFIEPGDALNVARVTLLALEFLLKHNHIVRNWHRLLRSRLRGALGYVGYLFL